MTAVLAALAFLVFGIALSIVAFLVIVMPAVAIVALVGWFFQPRRSRSTPPHGPPDVQRRLPWYRYSESDGSL